MSFERMDFLYSPSADVEADLRAYEELGARVVFAIESNGTRVAAVDPAEGPLVLFADHLEGQRAIDVYRVADLDAALGDLAGRGREPELVFEIPHGPCATFRTPTGHRFALYQLTRPEVAAHFEGRRDF